MKGMAMVMLGIRVSNLDRFGVFDDVSKSR